MALDESAADDGAAHAFWAFIIARRLRRDLPQFDVDDLVGFLEAVAAFEVAHAGGEA